MLSTRSTIAHDLLLRMADARERSDALFRLIRPGSLYCRPIAERHRIIFYIGHLEAFDWNLLHDSPLNLKSHDAEFDRLFAFGIDPVGTGLPDDEPSDWPALEVVRDYVARTRDALDDKLPNALDGQTPSRDGFPLSTLVNVAVEHRLMHVETLAYMLHQLPLDAKISECDPPEPSSSAVLPQMIEIPAGQAMLGLRRDSEEFGWDNEYEAHTVDVPAFEIDRYKVANRQFLEFIVAGGYEKQELWGAEDWNWKSSSGITNPVFWRRVGDQWLYRTMFEEIALPLDWPVYVSQAEASAYAKWAGRSLPSEAEWHRAAYATADAIERRYPWGDDTRTARRGNFDFARWNPTPVNAFPIGKSFFGVEDLLGNGWEWTSTVFSPFRGFQAFPFYPGYSANFFDGKHFVMKGGSPRTAASMLRSTFRNWFQAHYQYVYAGFRCVRR